MITINDMSVNDNRWIYSKLRNAVATSIYLQDGGGFKGYDDASKKCQKILIANELSVINEILKIEDLEKLKQALIKRTDYLNSL